MLVDDHSNPKRKGIYNHLIIEKAVNIMWFKNKQDEGILNPDLPNQISKSKDVDLVGQLQCKLYNLGR